MLLIHLLIPCLVAQTAFKVESCVVDRKPTITQSGERSHPWTVNYCLRNSGNTPIVVPETSKVVIDSQVSNSNVLVHGIPRRSLLDLVVNSKAKNKIIDSADSEKDCGEAAKVVVWVGSGDEPPKLPDPGALTVPPLGELHVKVYLDHQHFLYGFYDALLGIRHVELHLGDQVIKDEVDLRKQIDFRENTAWTHGAAADRTTTIRGRGYVHLESSAGNYTIRWPERAIKYNETYTLSLWYRMSPGTEKGLEIKASQLREGSMWKSLSGADATQLVENADYRWHRVDRTFKTHPEATTLVLQFSLPGDVGDALVGNVTLTRHRDLVDRQP